jgi:chromosome segregation ATPase
MSVANVDSVNTRLRSPPATERETTDAVAALQDQIRALQDQINVLELTKRAFESEQRDSKGVRMYFDSEIKDLKASFENMEADKFQRGVDRTQLYQSIAELYERMRKVEELGAGVEGHTHTVETNASTADRDVDRAAMAALVERVKALEKPWFGRFGKTRVQPGADVSIMLRRMNELNS